MNAKHANRNLMGKGHRYKVVRNCNVTCSVVQYSEKRRFR